MKKAFIWRTSYGELANQLWNYISIYAYCKESGRELRNYSFFEYGAQFDMSIQELKGNFFYKYFFFKPYENHFKRKNSLWRKIGRKKYKFYTSWVYLFKRKSIIKFVENENLMPYYLPPTKEADDALKKIEREDSIYFDGWLFRNPKGIEKYRNEIKEYFKPKKEIREKIQSIIAPLREKYTHIVGVHIRQGDYKTWKGGKYFIDQKRVKEILEEYLAFSKNEPAHTCFLIMSDGTIDETQFSGLNILVSKENAVTDLFLLASTDIIIGSNGTFSPFASYYGNIPLIVMQNETIDWTYYQGKTVYFENKHSTFVSY
jgi:hypothetical protein